MSRLDAGNYLGLTEETLSRVFSRMQKLGVLSVDNKKIKILDAERARTIASLGLWGSPRSSHLQSVDTGQ
ncbi:MAG: CRP/FNR family transcriptional regulator [Alcanivorax sp.]|jgi:CRP/FNR family transcriptional regulator